MNGEHVISDEVLEIIQLAIGRNESWMAYSNSLYFLDKEDVQFFSEKQEAEEFVLNNISDHDHFNLIHIRSLTDVFRQIPYGESLSKDLNNLSTKNVSIMTEQELAFVDKQFKKLGIAEAFNQDLINQMKSGPQTIEHSFLKNYEGDEAKATFHLRRSENSNLYFLNKYDLSIRKDGQTNEHTHTFYLNNFKRSGNDENLNEGRYHTTFTFKAAFNYLSGRPVLNTYQNQRGEQYQSWDVLNAKKTLPNGKMEEKHYHENYGFDIEKVLKNYSIKELTNPEYKERLLQSLQRGNLQSVTFVATDGKTAKLSISPNIPLGSINVFDETNTRIPTEKLVESGFIGKELAEKIQMRIDSITQNGKQTQRQQTASEVSQKQNQAIKEEVKQKQEPTSSKQLVRQNNKSKKDELNDGTDGKKQSKRQRQKIQ